MLKLLVVTACVISNAMSYDKTSLVDQPSAASQSQIKTALENNFDDTGPGAKSPEYAYRTFKSLDEALVNYLIDEDTMLPHNEKNVAVRQLLRQLSLQARPRLVGQYTRNKKPIMSFSHIPSNHKEHLEFHSPLTNNAVIKNFYVHGHPRSSQSLSVSPMVTLNQKENMIETVIDQYPQFNYAYSVLHHR